MRTANLKEWIGKTDDSRPPRYVRTRIFEANGGICHLAKRKIMPGEPWDLDHVKALVNGGENRESNLAPALRDKHREKTRADVAEKKINARIRAKHIGARPSSRGKLESRGFPKAKPQRTASRPFVREK